MELKPIKASWKSQLYKCFQFFHIYTLPSLLSTSKFYIKQKKNKNKKNNNNNNNKTKKITHTNKETNERNENNDYGCIQSIPIVEFKDSLGIVFFASKNPYPWDHLLHPTTFDI